MTIQVDEVAVPIPFDVLFWRIVLEMPPPETKSKGGIVLPAEVLDAQKTLSVIGRVIAIGSMCFKHRTQGGLNYADEPHAPRIGEYVLVGRFVGQDFALKDGRRFKAIYDNECLIRTTTPEEFVAYV